MIKHILSGVLSVLISSVGMISVAIAQEITNTHWYFGNSTNAIIFDKDGNESHLVSDQATPFSRSGSAVIADKETGDLLFYTDGISIYDNLHQILPGLGTSVLNADTTLIQPVVSCPTPDNSDQYFIFTNAAGTIEQTKVDPSLPGNSTNASFPLGDIIGNINEPTGLTNQAELMKIIRSTDGQAFWLITQDADSLHLTVSAITSNGIGSINTYDVFPDSLPDYEVTAIALKRDTLGTTLALAPKQANRNIILVSMDEITGALAFQNQIPATGIPNQNNTVVFDAEWSAAGTKLYLSETGNDSIPGQIYQIDLLDSLRTGSKLDSIGGAGFFRSYGLQRAIDGNIYHLHQLSDGAPFTVGRISGTDEVADSPFLEYDSLFYSEDFQGKQFPEFAPAYIPQNFFNMDAVFFDNCSGSTSKFVATVDPLPNNFYWDFGDGSFGAGPAPIHEFESSPGIINLIVELNGIIQRQPVFFDITQVDSVDLGADTTICTGETLELSAGPNGSLYTWSTGLTSATDSTLSVTEGGIYWVEVTYANGCTSYDEIEINEYGINNQRYHQWYFGNEAGLNFEFNPPSALTDGAMNAPEGCATISDVYGELSFYTDGHTVYNKEHNVMVNGDTIGGDPNAAQSALIVPFADERNLYYIFTTEQVYGDLTYEMKMSIVDMRKDSTRGEVIVKNVPVIGNSTERLAVSGYEGTPYLMTHEYGNRNFRGYLITDTGVGNSIHSSAGSIHAFQDSLNATGYMKFSTALDLIGVALATDTGSYVDLLDFDIQSGLASNSRFIDIGETDPIYGIEFSGGGKMYVTTNNKLIQFDLDSINSSDPISDIEATKRIISEDGGFGALQQTVYGQIYIAREGSNSMASIDSPDSDGDVGYNASAVDLNGKSSRLGLPDFTQILTSPSQTPSISVEQACIGVETAFSATGRDSYIETYLWDFDDGMTSTEQNTLHEYLNPGAYNVTMTLSNRCDVDSVLTALVNIYPKPENPIVPEDTALCGGIVILDAWPTNDPTLSYYWSNGDTTRQSGFFQPEIVDVAIISEHGCSSDTLTVFVGDDETYIELGEDQTICENDVFVLDANDPGPNFQWFRGGRLVGTDRTQRVNSRAPGTYQYSLEIVNDFTGCIYNDSINITIQPAPSAIQTDITNPNCGLPDGSFALQIDSAGNYTYSLRGPVNIDPQNFDGPGTSPAFTELYSGSYTSRVTNTVTGCITSEIIQLEDNAPYEMEAIPLNECARNSDIAVTFNDRIPASVEINVINESGDNVYTTTTDLYNKTVYIDDLDSGLYFVEVTDLNPPGCIQTDTVQLSVSIDCYRQIFVPNAFTPNGDGLNDSWYAFPHDFVDDFKIYIFNRWGDVIFYSTDRNFQWDGSYAGGDVPQGTYAYKMLFTTTLEPEAGTFEQSGSVTVLE